MMDVLNIKIFDFLNSLKSFAKTEPLYLRKRFVLYIDWWYKIFKIPSNIDTVIKLWSSRTDKRIDRQTNGQTNVKTDVQTDRRTGILKRIHHRVLETYPDVRQSLNSRQFLIALSNSAGPSFFFILWKNGDERVVAGLRYWRP